jgi:2-oxoglutarate dehydrogenase E2 component (dihydrolipoamide succinyltransferase)
MSAVEDVVAPDNQEGTKAVVLRWSKAAGQQVLKDEPLLELETDKVTVEIASPVSGELIEIVKIADQEVAPGEILGRVRVGSAQAQVQGQSVAATAVPLSQFASLVAKHNGDAARALLSPSVRRLLANHALSASQVAGSGRNGRATAQDVTRYVTELATRSSALGTRAAGVRIPHSSMRRRIAEHMVSSLSTAPHVTTLFEADLSQIVAHRSRHAAAFKERGTALTMTAYFVAACAAALREHPEVNATFHADALELHSDINIGVGTALGRAGLIVPVIHRVQDLDLDGIARRLAEKVAAARANKLNPADVRGGTFTISNHGVSGSLLAAPIVINQPQVAILGVGKAERRVCVIESNGSEAIAIRTMAYLTLTLDHRAIDAFQANAFLSHVVKTLEQWPQA